MGDHFNIAATGARHKAKSVYAYGQLATGGAVSNKIIWPNGTYAIPTSAGLSMSIASTSAQDSSAGTGIRTVEVHYLDVNLDEQIETVTLNGTTAVALSYAYIRFVQCVHALTVGSAGAAVGAVRIYVGAQNYAEISINEVRCTSSARMVPRNKVYYVNDICAGSSSGTAATDTVVRLVATYIDTNLLTDVGIFMPHGGWGLQDNSIFVSLRVPFRFPEGAVIGLTTTTDKAATVTGSWYGWEELATD